MFPLIQGPPSAGADNLPYTHRHRNINVEFVCPWYIIYMFFTCNLKAYHVSWIQALVY